MPEGVSISSSSLRLSYLEQGWGKERRWASCIQEMSAAFLLLTCCSPGERMFYPLVRQQGETCSFFPLLSRERNGERKRRLLSSRESVEQQVRQEGEGCRSRHKESLDAGGLGRFSVLPHCYSYSLLSREMPTREGVGASYKMRL